MSFSQAAILDVAANRRGAEVAVSWISTAAAGTLYQVYVDRALAWWGTRTVCVLPWPGSTAVIDVGTVASNEGPLDLSGTLPALAGGGSKVTLAWLGGAFLGSVAGFHVYSGTVAGGAVSYAAPIATVTAYPLGIVNDGYGMGGYGTGGYGHVAGSYSITVGPFAAGTWNFGIKSFDAAGNEGTAATSSATIAGPPRPPARDTAGNRVEYIFGTQGYGTGGYGDGIYGTDNGYGIGGYGLGGYGVGLDSDLPYVTLTWLASPGF